MITRLKTIMERVEAYRNAREMTPEVLLQLTQSYKYRRTKHAFLNGINVIHNDMMVTQEEIEDMGETLKMIVFFVSPAIMRSAVYLAKERSRLILDRGWLKEELV